VLMGHVNTMAGPLRQEMIAVNTSRGCRFRPHLLVLKRAKYG
jgi:hypothetical protein